MPRQRWDALVRGDGCPLCAELASGEAENTHGFVVAEFRISQLRLSREQHVPGELAPEERGDFFTDLLRAGEALEHVYAADKIDYQILGNLVPHLHAHIQPRFHGDAYPGQPVSGAPEQPVFLPADEYLERIAAIRAALQLL